MSRDDIRQALARGYCTERNSHKVLDSDLIEDMVNELSALKALKPKLDKGKLRDIIDRTLATEFMTEGYCTKERYRELRNRLAETIIDRQGEWMG